MKRISKRIEKITIKRMTDEGPDTSYLGEYSDRAKSDYTIDRKHDVDCPSQTYNKPIDTLDKLERAIAYLNAQTCQRIAICPNCKETITDDRNVSGMQRCVWCHTMFERESLYVQSDEIAESIQDAQNVLIEMQDALQECNCDERGDMGRYEYRYFNPCPENYKGKSPADIRKYCQRDYERMERLNRGDWAYVGVRADAEIVVDGVLQEISSGGLWGVESDSDASYLKEIETEQLSELRDQLRALGFGTRAISTAFKNVEHAEWSGTLV